MKKIFLLLLIVCSAGKAAAQNDSSLHVSDFIGEIQKVRDGNHKIKMVIWMPWQYWEAAMKQALSGKPIPEEISSLISSMKDYNIFCVVDAQVSPYGLTYRSEESIRDSIYMNISDSLKLFPIKETEMNEDVKMLISKLKPVFASMLGQLGDHISLFVFKNTNAKGQRYIDAAQQGKFSVTWETGISFTWRLPLDVLTPPKYCPADGEKLSGKFIYCPYHGTKLKTTK